MHYHEVLAPGEVSDKPNDKRVESRGVPRPLFRQNNVDLDQRSSSPFNGARAEGAARRAFEANARRY